MSCSLIPPQCWLHTQGPQGASTTLYSHGTDSDQQLGCTAQLHGCLTPSKPGTDACRVPSCCIVGKLVASASSLFYKSKAICTQDALGPEPLEIQRSCKNLDSCLSCVGHMEHDLSE